MIAASQDQLARTAVGDQAEILKIVRSIRDELKLVPNKVIDELSDRVKEMGLSVGTGEASGECHSHDAELPAEPGVSDEAVMPSGITEPINEASDELSYLNTLVQEKRISLQELSQSLEIKRKEVEGLESQKARLVEVVVDLECSEKKAYEQVLDLESKKATLSEELGEYRSIAEQTDAICSLKEERDRALVKESELLAQCEELRKLNAIAQALSDRLWPVWLKAEDMGEWKMAIESALADNTSSPAVGLLFAAIHSFSAAMHDEDPKTLHDSLRDVGRRLYAWLLDAGRTDEEASTIAEKWAKSINEECRGRGEIEVPVPGHAANNQWMIFQPRGGSSPDVLSVRSWCVRDSLKRPVHRAEVTV